MKYILPALPYDYGALEPYIDTLTMEIHHTGHHQTYINNLNNILDSHTALRDRPLSDLLLQIDTLDESVRIGIRNNGGGHYNHSLFWKMMKKDGGGQPRGVIKDVIDKTFESFDAFKEQFNTSAKTVFGSGWAWLCVDFRGKLCIVTTANQDCPLSRGYHPILGLDVWEHAYYLRYQNRRPDYIQAWWHVINWEQVEENYRMIKE